MLLLKSQKTRQTDGNYILKQEEALAKLKMRHQMMDECI